MKLMQIQKDLLSQLYNYKIKNKLDNRVACFEYENYVDINNARVLYRIPKDRLFIDCSKIDSLKQSFVPEDVDILDGFEEVFFNSYKLIDVFKNNKAAKEICVFRDMSGVEISFGTLKETLKYFENPRIFIKSESKNGPELFYIFEDDVFVGLTTSCKLAD